MAYVYRHIRLDKNEPFYIGISNEKSGKYYRAFSRLRNKSRIWNRVVAKTEYCVEVLIDNISWEDACEKEKEFIMLYGRIDLGTRGGN